MDRSWRKGEEVGGLRRGTVPCRMVPLYAPPAPTGNHNQAGIVRFLMSAWVPIPGGLAFVLPPRTTAARRRGGIAMDAPLAIKTLV